MDREREDSPLAGPFNAAMKALDVLVREALDTGARDVKSRIAHFVTKLKQDGSHADMLLLEKVLNFIQQERIPSVEEQDAEKARVGGEMRRKAEEHTGPDVVQE